METILSFIVVLGVIVFVHELGHFLAAKAVGIRVEQFSLGYPPKMIGRTYGDTEYCLSWIPLGGYVKMSGMIDESLAGGDSLTGAPYEFMSKNTFQKLFVIVAGVVMNFILAFILYTAITAADGVMDPDYKPYLGGIVAGSVADKAGLAIGDRLASIDGHELEDWTDLVSRIHPYPNQELTFVIERDGVEQTILITPEVGRAIIGWEMEEVGMIGISPMVIRRAATNHEILTSGWYGLTNVITQVVKSLWLLVSGQAKVGDLGGPVMIAKMSGDAASLGIIAFFSFIAFISINIGCLNLLPIPALDGGHFVIIAIEGLIRRELPIKGKMIVQQVGMFFLMGLILFIIWNDIQRIFGFEWLKNIF